jgi:hypothetical protein
MLELNTFLVDKWRKDSAILLANLIIQVPDALVKKSLSKHKEVYKEINQIETKYHVLQKYDPIEREVYSVIVQKLKFSDICKAISYLSKHIE